MIQSNDYFWQRELSYTSVSTSYSFDIKAQKKYDY